MTLGRLAGVVIWLAGSGVVQAGAQNPAVHYDVRFADLPAHEVEITATFSGAPPGPLEIRMSRSSPGRYAVHEFAKNVYRVQLQDGRGRSLTATRPNPHQWDVSGHDGTVRVSYTLFGDRGDGTYAQFDRGHALFNMPAAFMWARGLTERPISITFHGLPSSWKVATQLRSTREPNTFTAPNLQYFLDSPTHVGPAEIRSWTVAGAGRTDTIRLVLHDPQGKEFADRYADLARRVVAEQAAVFGRLAPFDYGVYTFIADYMPQNSGDGMEHRNSTILSSPASLQDRLSGNLATLSHEFFHSWNVERIRPKALEPFDFEDANMSGELWLAEGFTSYYGPLTIRRAGLTDDAEVLHGFGGTLDAVINGPGRGYFSPVEMSRQAPFVDAAVSIDPTNRASTFISYYTWGAALGLGLDLTLRSRFRGVTLDDFMRALWQAHGAVERPYTLADLRTVLGAVTRDQAFADRFFADYIDGRGVPDYAALLARAGVLLRPANPGAAWIGNTQWAADSGGVRLVAGAVAGSPLRAAGLGNGDLVLSLGGRTVKDPATADSLVRAAGPGRRLAVEFISRGERLRADIRTVPDPRLEAVPKESVGRSLSGAEKGFRDAWLGARAPAKP